MEIPNPAGRSVPGRCQPSQPTRRTAEPASSPGTRRTISFINVASAASLAEGELQSTLQDCGRAEVGLVSPRKCGCLRVPTASPRKGLVQRLPRDCGARAGRTASVPCPLSPVPVPQPIPSPQQPSPPRPAPSKPRCEKRSAVRGGGTRGLHAENTLGLLPGVPATARIGTPACRAALVPWEAPSPEHTMPRDPPHPRPAAPQQRCRCSPLLPLQAQSLQHRELTGEAQQRLLQGFCICGEAVTPLERLLMEAFGVLLLPPLPSCPSVRTSRSLPQHQQGFTSPKPVPRSPPRETNPIGSQHPKHFKPHHEGTQPRTRMGTHLPRCRHCPRCARPAPACPCPAPAEGDKGAVGATPSWCWTASQKEHHRVAPGAQTRHPPVPLTSLTRSVLCSLPATTPSGCPWGLLILPGDREGGGSVPLPALHQP